MTTRAHDLVNPMAMAGRRVMVTGASSGIGRAVAVLLSRLGAEIVLVARNPDRLAQTHALLAGEGHQIAERDLGKDLDTIPTWMKELSERVGPMHGFVHSAGIISMIPVRAISVGKLTNLMDINFHSAVMLVKGFRQRGVLATPASIVMLSSIAGLVGQRGLSAYCGSKGALMSLTRSLALELADDHIRVNCVAPGLVDTDMATNLKDGVLETNMDRLVKRHPLGVGAPADIANAVAFLLANSGRWITGSTLVVDGGYLANGL